ADLLYAAPEIGQRGWETERGRIIVRYGPPDVDVVITGAFEEALHNYGVRFDDEARQAGVRYDMAARSNLFNVWDYGDFKFVFEDPLRNGEFRLYSPPAYVFSEAGAGAAEKTDYAIIAENTFRERPEDYDYEASGRVVDVPYLVTAFKGDGGQTDLYVHYGIPLDAGADLSEELLPLTVRTGAFLITEDRDIAVERRRTIYGLRTSQVVDFDEARLWADTEAMEAQPGSHTVSLEFETASGAVQAVQRRDVEVPDFTAGGLALSDPMLAYAVEEVFDEGDEGVSGGLVRRGDFAIQPAPWSVFDAEQPVYVYFETYGLDQNDAGQNQYAVEVTLRPKDTSSGLGRLARSIFGGRDPGVAVEFEAGGTGPDDATYTILDVRDQEPGLYTLTLRVRDAFSGRTTDHTQDLFLE
ncbi:MAG: hypothetical protein R3362_03520, partial [Rhodothermales bacterium]|nr:hypothetical protein [Rhodothermales bacterium]